MRQFGVRLQGADQKWVEEQMRAGKTARQAVEAAIRAVRSASPAGGPRRLHAAGKVRLRRLAERQGRRLRQEVRRREAAEAVYRFALTRVAALERARGELAVEAARLRAEAAARDLEAAMGRSLEERVAAEIAEMKPTLAALHRDVRALAGRVGTDADQVAGATRQQQRQDDAARQAALAVLGHAAGRLAERRGDPVPEEIRACLKLIDPDHALLSAVPHHRNPPAAAVR